MKSSSTAIIPGSFGAPMKTKPASVEQKDAWYDPLVQMLNNNKAAGGNDYSYGKGSNEGYLGTDIIYSGVDLLAAASASVPKRAMQRLSDGKSEPLPDDHPLNKLLRSPNFLQKETGFAYASVAYRILGGDTFIWVNTGAIDPTDMDAEPLELWALPPTAAELRNDNGNWYYQVSQTSANCTSVAIPQRHIPLDTSTGRSNIIQWSTFNPNTICRGASPLRAANTNWDIYRFGNIWNRAYFEHGCRPSTALVSGEAGLGDKQFNRLKKELNEVYSGLANGNGRPIVLDNVKPVELSKGPKDSDFAGSHDQMQRDIARTMRIPPILLSLGADSTFTNQEQARLWLWDETIVPLTNDFVAELNLNLVPRFRKDKNIFIEADYSEVPALEPRRIERWKRADDSDDLSINEKRDMKGLEPVPGGDVILVDSNKIPLQLAAFTPPTE